MIFHVEPDLYKMNQEDLINYIKQLHNHISDKDEHIKYLKWLVIEERNKQ